MTQQTSTAATQTGTGGQSQSRPTDSAREPLAIHIGQDDGLVHNHNWAVSGK